MLISELLTACALCTHFGLKQIPVPGSLSAGCFPVHRVVRHVQMDSVSTALEEGPPHQTTLPFQLWVHRAGAFSDEAWVLSSWLLSGRCGSLVGFLWGTHMTGLVFPRVGIWIILFWKHIHSGSSTNTCECCCDSWLLWQSSPLQD